jgi:CBS domain containing-hemolysin-like protein
MIGLHVVLLCVLFIAINGVFVAAEFALLAAPRATFERRAASGDRFSQRLLAVLTSPPHQDRYVATAQIGITLASLGLGMYGEHELARLLAPIVGPIPMIGGAALAGALALGALTLAHIVFGEMVPKGVALQHPEGVARIAFWPMRATLVLLYPFVVVSSGVARLCLALMGIRRQTNVREQLYTPEELQLIVEESAEGGALGADSGLILRELFGFGDLTAREAMVPRVRIAGIPLGATPADIRAIVLTHRRTRYPVFEGDLDHIVGMLHVKDLLRRLIQNEPVTMAEVRRIPFVPATAPLDDVMATMQRAHAHLAVVIDEHGGTAGLITLEDLFEEVVGEIDEGHPSAPPLVPAPDGSVRAAGTVRLDELGQHFNLDLEHEEVDSVSGLVLARLGRPPVVGDVVDYGRIRLEVTATTGRGVKDVRVSLLPETDEA